MTWPPSHTRNRRANAALAIEHSGIPAVGAAGDTNTDGRALSPVATGAYGIIGRARRKTDAFVAARTERTTDMLHASLSRLLLRLLTSNAMVAGIKRLAETANEHSSHD